MGVYPDVYIDTLSLIYNSNNKPLIKCFCINLSSIFNSKPSPLVKFSSLFRVDIIRNDENIPFFEPITLHIDNYVDRRFYDIYYQSISHAVSFTITPPHLDVFNQVITDYELFYGLMSQARNVWLFFYLIYINRIMK